MTTKHHAGTKLTRTLNKGTHTRPSPFHGGSGALKGRVNEAPTRPRENPSGGMHGGSGKPQGVLSGKR
jgi:hypothetical protein